jgi:hypothetical protein
MSIVLLGSTSGSCTLQEQAVAGTTTLTLPTFNGTVGLLVSGTAVTASGSSVDFTGIPAGVRRITVTMVDLSFAAAGAARIRLGTSGGIVTTGYFGAQFNISTVPSVTSTALSSSPEGIAGIPTSANATTVIGQFIIVNVSGNTWQCNGFLMRSGDNASSSSSGYITLSGTLDRLSLAATTSTFDGGTINILYE